MVLCVAAVVVVVAVSVSESLVDWRDSDERNVFAVEDRWLCIPDDGGRTIGMKCSLACGSKLVARCGFIVTGVNGAAVECSAMGALRRSGTWCCISVENLIGFGCGDVSVLMSNWISVFAGFLRGNVLDFKTISARLVFTPPLAGSTGSLGSGARTGLITFPVVTEGTPPEIDRPLAPNGTGGFRIPKREKWRRINGENSSGEGLGKKWPRVKRNRGDGYMG